MSTVKGKVVIITGAGSGFGKAAAIAFAKKGAKLVICGRELKRIQLVEEMISSFTQDVIALKTDVSIEKEVEDLIKVAVAKFGRIDILINNAAVFENYNIADSTLESWNYHFDNNVKSAFLMSRGCIPVMQEQKAGKIISITSGLAREGASGFGAYSATKAAVETLMYSINEEEYKNGISAYVFNPGVMKTELQASGEDPSSIAPFLVELATSDSSLTGRVVTVEDLNILEDTK